MMVHIGITTDACNEGSGALLHARWQPQATSLDWYC